MTEFSEYFARVVFWPPTSPTPVASINEKSARRRRKHYALAVVKRSQKFRPAAHPFHRGAGWTKFNQLEMVTSLPLRLQTQFGEDRYTQFRVIVVTDLPCPPPYTQTKPQTGPITIHCTAKLSAQYNNNSKLYNTSNL